jgi:hypothetical protein
MALNAKITTQKEAEENTARLAKVKIGRIYLYVGRSCSVNLLQKCNELSGTYLGIPLPQSSEFIAGRAIQAHSLMLAALLHRTRSS